MSIDFSTVLSQVIGALVGLFVGVIGLVGGFYMKRLNSRLNNKTITDEINRYVMLANQTKSFQAMGMEDRKATILESIKIFAAQNDINIPDSKVILMIEQAIQFPKQLENRGLQLMLSKGDKNVKRS